MDLDEIDKLILELNTVGEFDIGEKPLVRDGYVKIQHYTVLQSLYRIYNGDSFDRSMSHLNTIACTLKRVCRGLLATPGPVDDVHYKNYLKSITEKLHKCIHIGLPNLMLTYASDKNKLVQLQLIMETFQIQIMCNQSELTRVSVSATTPANSVPVQIGLKQLHEDEILSATPPVSGQPALPGAVVSEDGNTKSGKKSMKSASA